MVLPDNVASVTIGGLTYYPGQEIPDDTAKALGLLADTSKPAAKTSASGASS